MGVFHSEATVMGSSSTHMPSAEHQSHDHIPCKGCWESHIRNLILFVTLWAVTEDMRLHEGVPVSLRPPAGH